MPNETHILLVDDEEHIRRGLSQLLELEGYSVVCAQDGAEGLEMLTRALNGAVPSVVSNQQSAISNQQSFDLLISDIKMPRLDGLSLLSAVRERAPGFPVLLITGHGDLDTAIDALRRGAYDFVTKPFEDELVLAAVRRALEKTRLEQELAQAQKLAALGTLAAGVAHELNTPLNAIVGAAERLLKRLTPSSPSPDGTARRERGEGGEAKYLDMIIRNGLRCAKIVQAVKTYARGDPLSVERFDLNAVVQDSLILIEHALKGDSNVSVQTDLAPNLPPLSGDPNKLTQVFINLLNNARDAMPMGGDITVTTHPAEDGRSIVATVADTGTGIPPEALPRIFDPFFTTKAVGQGTGLGLSIVAGIVRDHRGEIHVDSRPGRGTTFTITLLVSANGDTPLAAVPAAGRYDEQ